MVWGEKCLIWSYGIPKSMFFAGEIRNILSGYPIYLEYDIVFIHIAFSIFFFFFFFVFSKETITASETWGWCENGRRRWQPPGWLDSVLFWNSIQENRAKPNTLFCEEKGVCALRPNLGPLLKKYISTYFVPFSKPIIRYKWKCVSGVHEEKYMRSKFIRS